MKVIIAPTAQAQIEHQFAYGVARHGRVTASRTFARIDRFFETTLADYPRTGTFLPSKGLYETPILPTPFVVVYRVELDRQIVRVLGFFHHAQKRSDFEPNE